MSRNVCVKRRESENVRTARTEQSRRCAMRKFVIFGLLHDDNSRPRLYSRIPYSIPIATTRAHGTRIGTYISRTARATDDREYNVLVNRNRYFLHKSTCITSRDTEKSTAASLVCKCKPKAPPQEPKTLCLSSNRSISGIRCVSATTYGHTRLEQEKTLSTVPCLVVLQRRTHAPFVVLTSSKCIRF